MQNGILKRINWSRIRAILLCMLTAIFFCCTTMVVIAETLPNDENELLKTRLMYQIQYQGWDPYSADMSIEEFYALMELFDEGKLPLKSSSPYTKKRQSIFSILGNYLGISTYDDGNDEENTEKAENELYIPREKFMYTGLPEKYTNATGEEYINDEEDERYYQQLPYDNTQDYEPYDPSTGVLYELNEDGTLTVDGQRYTLNEEDGRLYSTETPVENWEKYPYAFQHVGNQNDNGAYVRKEGGYLYSVADGEPFEPNEDPKDNVFQSLSTGTRYVVDKGGDGLLAYDEDQSGNVIYGNAFNEPAAEYYVRNNDPQLYVWRNNALCVPVTNATMPYVKAIAYNYPEGLDGYNRGYHRPAHSWQGVPVDEKNNLRALVVLPEENTDRRISGSVDQTLFQHYDGYYVRRLTINGSDINILGLIQLEDRCVYYYLTAEGQSTDVSSTTITERDKFIVEYVLEEYTVDYVVAMNDNIKPNGELNYQNLSDLVDWILEEQQDYVTDLVKKENEEKNVDISLDNIFSKNRAKKTTEGAYSFDATVPYGYTMEVYISIKMSMELTNSEGTKTYTFDVHINHTGAIADGKENAVTSWLTPFYECLHENGFLDAGINDLASFRNAKIANETEGDNKYGWKWSDEDDPNVEAYNDILQRMTERLNDFTPHNYAHPLGTEPEYTVKDAFTVKTAEGLPPVQLMTDTFYNHLVKADRTIVAVLTRNEQPPIFDAATIIRDSTGTSNRGTSAKQFVDAKIKGTEEKVTIPYDYEDLYLWANNGQDSSDSKYDYFNNESSRGGASLDNIKAGNIATSDNWVWENKQPTADTHYNMTLDEEDGTYYGQWTFQTNSGESYVLDAFAVNGVSMSIPFHPKNIHPGSSIKDDEAASLTNYFTEMKLANGATVRLEFLMIFGSTQRVYKLIVTGAKSNVTVTGMNLMQNTSGASEVVTYDFEGVYAGKDQNAESIQYYSIDGNWTEKGESQIIVNSEGKGFKDDKADLYDGDSELCNANVRFKVADGYGSPYFIFANRNALLNDSKGVPQTSIQLNEDGSFASTPNGGYKANAVQDFPTSGSLDSQHIYYNSADGWYYIRLDTQGSYKIGLITIVARTMKYTVRYIPSYTYLSENNDEGITYYSPDGLTGIVPDPVYMPTFNHTDLCDQEIRKAGALGEQYDDNNGYYYDLLRYNTPTIRSDVTPRDPNTKIEDDTLKYEFVDWVLVDVNFLPVRVNKDGKVLQYSVKKAKFVDENEESDLKITVSENGVDTEKKVKFVDDNSEDYDAKFYVDEDGGILEADVLAQYEEIHYISGVIDLNAISDYAVQLAAFSNDEQDLCIVRLMPVWRVISNPFHYDVILNWVDTLGNVHAEDLSASWDVVTETPEEGGNLYVFINREVGSPLYNWIANHPTYNFWDEINNTPGSNTGEAIDTATGEYIKSKIADYLKKSGINTTDDNYNEILDNILKAVTGQDFYAIVKDEDGNDKEDPEDMKAYTGFRRLGSDTFAVLENKARICIWMFEDKGGLIFHKDVKEEPFTPDDEFYFTITNASAGTNDVPLDDSYKAYPQFVYDENGNPRAFVDADAWLLTFDNGEISEISKGGSTLYEVDDEGNYVLGNDGKPIPVTYFTLKDGEGIQLYVPDGKYTIVELGSKSGGSYKASVEYTGDNETSDNDFVIPDSEGLWLKGSAKQFYGTEENSNSRPENVSQVWATVNFDIGEINVVQIITFTNITTSLYIEKQLDGEDIPQNFYDYDFTFTVQLKLQENDTPIAGQRLNNDGTSTSYYYFVMNVYHDEIGERGEKIEVGERSEIVLTKTDDEEENVWGGIITLKAGYRAVIVMQVLEKGINYSVKENVDWDDEKLAPLQGEYSGQVDPGKQARAPFTNFYGELPEVEYGYIKITVKGGNANESFLFKIVSADEKISITVSVKGGSSTYVYVKLGEYTVTEISGWAWRYGVTTTQETKIEVKAEHTRPAPYEIVYVATENDMGWLGGENYGDFWRDGTWKNSKNS